MTYFFLFIFHRKINLTFILFIYSFFAISYASSNDDKIDDQLVLQSNNYVLDQTLSKTGLYIEQLGRIRTYSTEWRLTTYINLTTYQAEFEQLRTLIDKGTEECHESFKIVQSDCMVQIEHIKSIFNEINEYDMNWFVDVRQVKHQKRALVNIVGSALRSLFGVLAKIPTQNKFVLWYHKPLSLNQPSIKSMKQMLFKIILWML